MKREWLVAVAVLIPVSLGIAGCPKKTTAPVNTGPEQTRPIGDLGPDTAAMDAPPASDVSSLPPGGTPSIGAGRTYIVQKGDGLMAIARKFYNGDASQWRKIAAANNIQNPNQLKVGQSLVIP